MSGAVTAKAIQAAALEKGLTWIPHHRCGGCNVMVGYSVVGGELYFEAACDCSSYPSPPQSRTWQDIVDWIDMQHTDAARTDILTRFGVTTESAK